MKKLIYINLVTVSESSEDLESLSVITVIKDGTNKYVARGLEEVAAAIIEMAEYLGQDHSELIPFALENKDSSEPTLVGGVRQRRRN